MKRLLSIPRVMLVHRKIYFSCGFRCSYSSAQVIRLCQDEHPRTLPQIPEAETPIRNIDKPKNSGLVPPKLSFDERITIRKVQNIVNRLCAKGDMGSAMKEIDEYKKLGSQPTPFMHTELMKAYMHSGETHKVHMIWAKLLKEEKTMLTPDMFTLIIKCCGSNGFEETAFDIFSQMEKYNIKPTLPHYTALVLATSERIRQPDWLSRNINRALTLMEDYSFTPLSPKIYKCVIKAFARAGETDAAELYLAELRARGFAPTRTDYNNVLLGCTVACTRRIEDPKDKYLNTVDVDHTRTSGGVGVEGRDSDSEPSPRNFRFGRSELTDYSMPREERHKLNSKRAKDIFQEMIAQGIEPDVETLTHLLGIHAFANDLENAQQVLAIFDQLGFSLSPACHFYLIRMHIRNRDLTAAFFYKEQMGVHTSIKVYTLLMRACHPPEYMAEWNMSKEDKGLMLKLYHEIKANKIPVPGPVFAKFARKLEL